MTNTSRHLMRARVYGLGAAAVVVALGVALKYRAAPPGWAFLADHAAGAPYVMLWMLMAWIVWPSPRPAAWTWTAGAVCMATVLLEFMQLWHPQALEAVRATWPGQLVLGSVFDAWDMAAYPVGAGAGWLLLAGLARSSGVRR